MYKKDFIKFLKNTEGNLMAEWTDDSTPFSELAYTAEEYIERGQTEGKIAALFIYQQLCIEIFKQLINYSNFYEKLCLYPTKIEFKKFALDASYSEILNELKFKPEFEQKKKLIQQVKIINDLRNKFGHELFSKWWEQDIDGELNDLRKRFEEIFETFKVCMTDLRSKISKGKLRPEISELMK